METCSLGLGKAREARLAVPKRGGTARRGRRPVNAREGFGEHVQWKAAASCVSTSVCLVGQYCFARLNKVRVHCYGWVSRGQQSRRTERGGESEEVDFGFMVMGLWVGFWSRMYEQ